MHSLSRFGLGTNQLIFHYNQYADSMHEAIDISRQCRETIATHLAGTRTPKINTSA